MNFLSHYYFDRHSTNCYHILGTVLPDLLKNADKTIILHPEKLHHTDASINSIIDGWKKHLAVDRHFHSDDFFINNAHQLKQYLTPVIAGSPVKPFFLGHIAFELLLDNLLVTTNQISINDFYNHLSTCKDEIISEFLSFSGLKEPSVFLKFFDNFKKSRYLHSYAETAQVAYALKRICMRIWQNPLTTDQEANINQVLINYRVLLIDNFMQIFNDIEAKLVN